jgi:ABC-type sulfate/molybdate transport systems ATPase subunit
VMDSILAHRHGKTTLLFGHRLSALDGASRIVVLAAGRVVESGSIDELIEHDGEFVRLFGPQLDATSGGTRSLRRGVTTGPCPIHHSPWAPPWAPPTRITEVHEFTADQHSTDGTFR